MSFSKNGIGSPFLDVLNNVHSNFKERSTSMRYSKVYSAKSDFLLFCTHEEKGAPDFSPNPTLQLLFAKNMRANCSKNASSLANQASKNKNEIVAHPTNHGNAHFEPTQQPTNNLATLI
jgi:hypothetical protein